MTKQGKWTRLIVMAGVMWALCAGYTVVTSAAEQKPQPVGKSSNLRIYTEAQALRGRDFVIKNCINCHHVDLNGGEGELDMSNEYFLSHWGLVSLGYIANYVYEEMPPQLPGRISMQEATDVVAYVLWLNYYPVGEKELPPDLEQLDKIRLQTPAEHFRLFVP